MKMQQIGTIVFVAIVQMLVWKEEPAVAKDPARNASGQSPREYFTSRDRRSLQSDSQSLTSDDDRATITALSTARCKSVSLETSGACSRTFMRKRRDEEPQDGIASIPTPRRAAVAGRHRTLCGSIASDKNAVRRFDISDAPKCSEGRM